jgi:hypothetical protein
MAGPSITITVKADVAQARRRLRAIQTGAERGAHHVVDWARQRIEDSAEQSLLEPKSGVKYARMPNRSSAPGEAPANQFGPLMKGINSKMLSALRGSASSTAPYAGYLEGGTSKMAARSHMVPALDKTTPEFIQRLIHMIEGL